MVNNKIPEIKVLPSCEGSLIHVVFVNGDPKYKCITKERGESIKEMAEALVSVYKDLEACDDWGTDIHTDTIEKVIVSLNKFGVNV